MAIYRKTPKMVELHKNYISNSVFSFKTTIPSFDLSKNVWKVKVDDTNHEHWKK